MTTFGQDQDHGNRWSSFLDFDSIFGPTSLCGHNNQGGGCIYHDQYPEEYHYGDRNCSYNELNQEMALQDFSRLAVEEATERSCAEEDQFSMSHHPANWIVAGPYPTYWPAHEGSEEVADDNEPSTSCSSPEERSYDGEDYSSYLELTDDSSIDGELGKRLNQMVPVPVFMLFGSIIAVHNHIIALHHVPRINGEIPSIDAATSDHQRLLDRSFGCMIHKLPVVYDLVERKVQGDGNCQFRALSDQFYRSPEHHKFVRQQVVNQLKSNPEDYEGYVPMEYDEYLEKMSKYSPQFSDLFCIANDDNMLYIGLASGEIMCHYGVKIFVITSFKDTCYIEILPKDERSKRVIFLSFWAEVHYNSIYPHGESPPSEFSRKKKKWWQFRHKH
ncbi:hypothetical protein V2J09_010610 [Rumex salicifolius]